MSSTTLAERALAAIAFEADPWFGITAVLDLVGSAIGCPWLGVIVPEGNDQSGYKVLAFRDHRPDRNAAVPITHPQFQEALNAVMNKGEARLFRVGADPGPTAAAPVDAPPFLEVDLPEEILGARFLPLSQGSETLGVLCLLYDDLAGLGRDLPDGVLTTTGLISLALRNLVLSGQLERQELFGQCSEQLVAKIASGATEQEIYEFLARFLGEAFGTDSASIGLLSSNREWLIIQASYESRPGHEPPMVTVRLLDDPRVAEVIVSGGVVELPDLTDPAIPESWRALATQWQIYSALSVPLADSDGVWGLAILGDEAKGPILGPRDRQLFRVLVQHAAPLLQNSRMLRELRHSVDGFKLLFETSREVSSVLNLSQVPHIVAQRAMDLSQSDECMVFLLEPDGRTLRPVLAFSEYEAEMMNLVINVGEGITGQVALSRTGEYVNRVDLDPRSRHIPGTPVTPEAMLAAPLLCADNLIGVMVLYKLDGRQYNHLDLATITIFATQAAIAIENARLFERVAAERTRLSTMIQQMEEAVFFCDGDGSILVVNSAAQRLTGRSDVLDGRPFLDVFQPEMREVLGEVLAALRGGNGRNITREMPLAGRYILGSFTAIRDEKDGIAGLVVLCKDITDMKSMESQLLQSSKMSAVGQLATGVAHEFNNLIAAIYGYAQFMKDNRDEKILKKGIDIILNSSERARDLTRSLLTFSRNSEGRFEAVDLNEVVDDALLLVEQQLTKEGIRIVKNYDRLPHAWADRGRLQEVFLNLISNSRHAMSDGGTLTITTRPEGHRLVAEVADSGVGIPPENLNRIFDPFFTTKGALGGARTPGTGLGLFTVYNTVSAHGGTVEVASSAETGTRVRILLPAKAAPPGTTRQPGAPPPDTGLRRAG